MRRLRVALALWRNQRTRHEALPYLVGQLALADWEIELLLGERPRL